MILHRLTTRSLVAEAMSGEGAKKFGGRWNRKGTPAVYASATLSLAVLETLVHTDSRALPQLFAFRVEVPENVPVDDYSTPLPLAWRDYPAPETLGDAGSAWLRASHAAILRVPSAVIPEEANFLLNPTHADFGKLIVMAAGRFELAGRLRARG